MTHQTGGKRRETCVAADREELMAGVATDLQLPGMFLMIERDWLKYFMRRAKQRSARRETRHTHQQHNGGNDDSLTRTDGLFRDACDLFVHTSGKGKFDASRVADDSFKVQSAATSRLSRSNRERASTDVAQRHCQNGRVELTGRQSSSVPRSFSFR